jgi:type I restriction enzyme, S subunit
MLGNLTIPLPPVFEQRAIADFIDQECGAANVATRRIREEIDLLREYRTRLIADVVTGKLDVREAAARLPDEADDSEPLDDADALAECDDADPDATPEEPEG